MIVTFKSSTRTCLQKTFSRTKKTLQQSANLNLLCHVDLLFMFLHPLDRTRSSHMKNLQNMNNISKDVRILSF